MHVNVFKNIPRGYSLSSCSGVSGIDKGIGTGR